MTLKEFLIMATGFTSIGLYEGEKLVSANDATVPELYLFEDCEVDGQLVEIKGDHLFKKMLVPNTLANAKYNCMLTNNVRIITSNEYHYYISFCENKFGKKWFLHYRLLYNK